MFAPIFWSTTFYCLLFLLPKVLESSRSPREVVEEKYFQDLTMSISPPNIYEFGHLYEQLNKGWEMRFERINYKDQRFQGKVNWGTSDGGVIAQHYYDFNHHNPQEVS